MHEKRIIGCGMGNSVRKEKRLTRAGRRLNTTSATPSRMMLREHASACTFALLQLHSISITFGQFETFRTRKARVVDSLFTPLPSTRLLISAICCRPLRRKWMPKRKLRVQFVTRFCQRLQLLSSSADPVTSFFCSGAAIPEQCDNDAVGWTGNAHSRVGGAIHIPEGMHLSDGALQGATCK